MQTDYVKAALMAGWTLAVSVIGYGSGTTSFEGWTLVAMLSVVPPVLLAGTASALSPNMSESVRKRFTEAIAVGNALYNAALVDSSASMVWRVAPAQSRKRQR